MREVGASEMALTFVRRALCPSRWKKLISANLVRRALCPSHWEKLTSATWYDGHSARRVREETYQRKFGTTSTQPVALEETDQWKFGTTGTLPVALGKKLTSANLVRRALCPSL